MLVLRRDVHPHGHPQTSHIFVKQQFELNILNSLLSTVYYLCGHVVVVVTCVLKIVAGNVRYKAVRVLLNNARHAFARVVTGCE